MVKSVKGRPALWAVVGCGQKDTDLRIKTHGRPICRGKGCQEPREGIPDRTIKWMGGGHAPFLAQVSLNAKRRGKARPGIRDYYGEGATCRSVNLISPALANLKVTSVPVDQ